MQEDVLEILCERPEADMEALADLASVKEAALFAGSLHLVADDGEGAGAETRQRLTEARLSGAADRTDHTFTGGRIRIADRGPDRAEQPQEEVRR